MRRSLRMMEWVVAWLAPRSTAESIRRFVELLLAINAVSLVVNVGFMGWAARGTWIEVAITSIVAAPFVGLALAALQYMRHLQQELARLATTDALTGLPNRRDFLTRLAVDGRIRQDGVLLSLDVDHFKEVNDAHGHATGDTCLRLLAERLRERMQGHALIARFGGEEFAVYLDGATLAEAEAACDRLVEPVWAETASGLAIRLSLSAGITMAAVGEPVDAALSRADAALYEAKARGRACIAVWDRGGPVLRGSELRMAVTRA